MDQETYEKGRRIRTQVLGEAYVRYTAEDDFTGPLQDLVTEYCWGAVWGRDGLSLKTRSMLNLAMIALLNRPNELRTHIRGALNNGVSRDEIREVFLQVAIYAGVPAAVDGFRVAREALAELDENR
ncbi:carboxymuconolactone decarboxylase family protein [Nocardia sp. NPDC019395]|uniref:carboxymuconolactone decarboxylase family protein n=1 Tax=Nocardia sp. NPDC019395 TaxID=3154686 RepID=UPI0034079D9D